MCAARPHTQGGENVAHADIIKNVIAEQTKELIRQKPIDSITVTEICEKTGMNRRTFYRYFRDKFEIVDWIYFHDALTNSPHYEGWSAFDYMPRIMESLYNDRKYYINAFKYRGQNSFRDYCTGCLKKLFAPDYEDAFLQEQWPAFFIEHLCEMTYDACVEWLSSEPCMPPDKFAAVYSAFLLKASSVTAQLLSRTPAVNAGNILVTHPEPAKTRRTRRG